MRNNNIKFILSILIVAFSILSCKKFLDAKSDTKLVTPSTLADLQALLDNAGFMNTKTPVWDEASADDYFLPLATYNARTVDDRQKYTWEYFDYTKHPNDWSALYDVVYNANTALENVINIERTSQNSNAWDNVKGSGFFFRAYSFLKTAWIFSKVYDETTSSQDLGIVLRTTTDFNVVSVRADVKTTYEKIIQDLHEAVQLLPTNPQHVMRPSKVAAYGLLARTYLSMRKYDSAYKYADMYLQIKNQLIDYNASPISSSLPFTAFNPEVIFHTLTQAYSSFNVIPQFGRVDTVLFLSYALNDLRRDAFFALNAGYRQFKGTYSGTANFLFNGIATDEIYLIRAECFARAGNTAAALQDLNTLMQKRWKAANWSQPGSGTPFTATDANDALNKILIERRKELIFRGLRWIDIKRLNKEGYNITPTRLINGQTYMLPPNDNRYALALPGDILILTGMPQNPR